MVSVMQTIDTNHEDMIHDAQMDYFGVKLATCSSDRAIKVFDVKQDQYNLHQELVGHEGPVWQLAWAHPKFGSILASCSYDKKVVIWKETNRKWAQLYTYTAHESSVNSVSWAPHEFGLVLACGSSDCTISIVSSVDGENWEAKRIQNAHSIGVNAVHWAPALAPTKLTVDSAADIRPEMTKRIVSGGCDAYVKIWREEDGDWVEETKLEGHSDWVRDVSWAPSTGLARSQIASCSQDGRVVVWTNDGAGENNWVSKEILKFNDVVWHASWSLTGNILAISGGDNKVTLWKETMDGNWQCISDVNKSQENDMKSGCTILCVVSVDFKDPNRVILTHEIDNIANHTHFDRHHGDAHSGSTILFIFAACLFGALIRSLVKETNFPFTVFIFILGCALGVLSVLVEEVSNYTLLASIDPHLMLHIFLPVLIFESAFALDTHTFVKSFAQVVVLAVPCFCLNVGLTAVLVKYLFPYEWTWPVSLAFGTIISATDPVAVVATLKELGTDKKLAIVLEGESLLNDGAALVFFTVFLQMARGEYQHQDDEGLGGEITLFFLRVLFGGLILGYLMGKLCSAWLGKIFNDAVAETIITIAFPYITYFIAEAVLGVSGVLAVVMLGVILSSEKTSISPEVERFLHSQWGLLAFASNTLIFTLVGIVISEQILRELSDDSSYSSMNWFYMSVLYLGITVVRGVSLFVFSPILRVLGYGFDWSKGIVMWWGALRGAVSLALALLVANDDRLDPHLIGNQFLVYTAAIVVLTLVLNGCTMRPLLQVLGLTKISMAKKMAMTSAVKALDETQKAIVANLKSDRFLADAHWDVVLLMSEIKNPYADRKIKDLHHKPGQEVPILENPNPVQNTVMCPDCNSTIKADLTSSQYKEYEEEARVRYLKAQKVSYWRQFEHGILGRAAVRKLLELTEICADKVGRYITLDDIRACWKMKGVYRLFPRLSKYLTNCCMALLQRPIPKNFKTSQMFGVAISTQLKVAVIIVVILQTLLGFIDLLMVTHGVVYHILFFVIALNFTLFFAAELSIKLIGYGPKLFFKKFWNLCALFCFIAAYPELYAGFTAEELSAEGDTKEARGFHLMSAVIRIARGIRLLEYLLEICLPGLLKAVDRRIESQINFGYDVGRGFVVGEEECRQLLDHIVEHPGMRNKFKNRCDKMRLAVIKELALLQKSNPGVAVAVKTRQATRTVLNKIIETLDKLKEDGLLDEIEADRLHLNTDRLIKLLVSAPPSVPPMPAEHMLSFVPWLQGVGISVIRFMRSRAQLVNMDHGDTILRAGEAPKGIYIVVSGLVKIFGRQRLHSHYATDTADQNSPDYMMVTADRFTDYLGAGAVLGEMGPLMDTHASATVSAETAVQLYFLNITDLEVAFDMYPEVKHKLWKNCAIKIILNLLEEQKEFQTIPKEIVRTYLDKGYIPHICEQTVLNLDDNIAYAFLIHGQVRPHNKPDLEFVGPSFIPDSIRVLHFNDPQETILYLVPGEEIPISMIDSFHEGIRNKLKTFASTMGRKLLKEDDLYDPASIKKTTFYDVIDMIRTKKLLNKKTTATLPEAETLDKIWELPSVDDEKTKLDAKLPSRLQQPKKQNSSSMCYGKTPAGPGAGKSPKSDRMQTPDQPRKALSVPVVSDVRSKGSIVKSISESSARRKDTPPAISGLPASSRSRQFHQYSTDVPANKPSKMISNKYSRHTTPQPTGTEKTTNEFDQETNVVVTVKSKSKENQANEVSVKVTVSPQVNKSGSAMSNKSVKLDVDDTNQAKSQGEDIGHQKSAPLSALSEKTESTKRSQEKPSEPEQEEPHVRTLSRQAWTPKDKRPSSVQSAKSLKPDEHNELALPPTGRNTRSKSIPMSDRETPFTPKDGSDNTNDTPQKFSKVSDVQDKVKTTGEESERTGQVSQLPNGDMDTELVETQNTDKTTKEQSPGDNINNSAFSFAKTTAVNQLHKTRSTLLRSVQRVSESSHKLMGTAADQDVNEAFSSVACNHENVIKLYMVCNVTGNLIEVHHCTGEDNQCDVRQVYRDIEQALSTSKLD